MTPVFDTSKHFVYRLNSGRDSYIANGGKLGRRKGSCKNTERKKEEYKEVISFLKRGYSVRNTAKLSSVSVSTVQRVKREFSKTTIYGIHLDFQQIPK